MKNYLDLMQRILNEGEKREDRTGVGTYSLFGEHLEFDLTKGFPAVTTKELWFRGVKEELAWMLRGETNVKSLNDADVHIWDEWTEDDGELGPIYGRQWRHWEGSEGVVDQVEELLHSLTHRPTSRRHVLSAWNVADLDSMALPPCHVMCQFYVSTSGNYPTLSCHMYQRSCDYFLGGPFNIAQYALLTWAIADLLGYGIGKLRISYGDVHIYTNHVEQCKEQLSREPRPLPGLVRKAIGLRGKPAEVLASKVLYYDLCGYNPHPSIKADIAV